MFNSLQKAKKPSQALVNVFSDKNCTFIIFPFYWWCTTSLVGTAVQYAELGDQHLQIRRPESRPTCARDEVSYFGWCYSLPAESPQTK